MWNSDEPKISNRVILLYICSYSFCSWWFDGRKSSSDQNPYGEASGVSEVPIEAFVSRIVNIHGRSGFCSEGSPVLYWTQWDKRDVKDSKEWRGKVLETQAFRQEAGGDVAGFPREGLQKVS